MSDIFVSYSHKNSEFGRKLHTMLIAKGRDPWMDWKDIPATAEWWEKICDGILASDNFILIISYDSIASPICNLEISYARNLNKRIIPILYREPDEKLAFASLFTQPLDTLQVALLKENDLLDLARDNWRAISSLQWIMFNDDTKFEEQTEELLNALDLDDKHVNEHTRLLVRAEDWNTRKQSLDLLLRGDDLENAETWLINGKSKIPKPTELQLTYLAESRNVDDRVRQQNEENKLITEGLIKQKSWAMQQNQLLVRRTRRFQYVVIIATILLVLAIFAAIVATHRQIEATSIRQTIEPIATAIRVQGMRAATQIAGFADYPIYNATFIPQNVINEATVAATRALWNPIQQTFDGVEMMLVPGGCFYMGTNQGNPDERPVHEICPNDKRDYWIDKFEITNNVFINNHGVFTNDRNILRGGDKPLINITWSEATAFCQQRDAQLPTEEEWEYAAREPNSLVYTWGNEWNDSYIKWAVDLTTTPGVAYSVPEDVGSRMQNASWVGALDMIGSVWEWTSSIVDLKQFAYLDAGLSPIELPNQSNEKDYHIIRGRSFISDYPVYFRSSYRYYAANIPHFLVGFRCIKLIN